VDWMHDLKPKGRAQQYTALHIATDRGHKEVVRHLVEKCGADLGKKAPYGENAVEHVQGRSGEGMSEIAGYLKMKAAMKAAIAAQKFKAMKAKE